MEIESRPIIFYYGDQSTKNKVEEFCSSSLAAKPVQWSRSPNRPSQNVHVDPSFLYLDLSGDNATSSINISAHPVAYVFICDNDPEYYDKKGKKELSEWFRYLSKNKISEWLIISVTDKTKRVPSRNLVGHKLKTDFSLDSVDRLVDLPCDGVTYPSAWQALLGKLRNIILRAFSSTLEARENYARMLLQSRRRNDFNFMEYFIAQEEVASLYCCLGLYEEALKCVDTAEEYLSEGLALAAEDEPTEWVRVLLKNSCESLITTPNIVSSFPDPIRMQRVKNRQANLFELRSHILSRQCALLQAIDRAVDLPRRGLRSVRLALKETRDLKLHVPQSQLHFWTFLCCLQILEAFRRSAPCSLKPELSSRLRRNFLQSNKTEQQHNNPSTSSSLTANTSNNNVLNVGADCESSCPSNLSEASSDSLVTARFDALESLELLGETSLQTEGAFHILARAVYASVVVDDCVKCGRCIAQHQALVGTSQWTVELWRLACVALGRLGRYLGIWPNLDGDGEPVLPKSLDKSLSLVLRTLNSLMEDNVNWSEAVNEVGGGGEGILSDSEKPTHRSCKGSFGAQLSVALISSATFEQIYRKIASVCIFFQWCSGARRAALCMSLELADFYRDARMFIRAESLYQEATKTFIRESWPALSTYSLLQQAFCQQVQWRTENADTIDASVFRRYVQTALLLAITPQKDLDDCYDQLRNRGSYFDCIFGDMVVPLACSSSSSSSSDNVGGYADSEMPGRTIISPWWPSDWWKLAVDIVNEHYARISSEFATLACCSPLHRLAPPPLTVRSLRPLFQLVQCDLEEVNPHTGKQMVRVCIGLAGARHIVAGVKLLGKTTVLQDWTVPPLACDAALPTNQMKYLHVDLGKEAAPLGPNNASDISIAARDLGTDNSGCGDPVITKESIMRRLFNRSRNSRGFFKKPLNTSILLDDPLLEARTLAKRPASIDFLGLRGRLNTLEKGTPVPSDTIMDGLTLSTDYSDLIQSAAATPSDDMSLVSGSVFSEGNFRRHKKGFSMTDWPSFIKSFKKTREDPNPTSDAPSVSRPAPPIVTTTNDDAGPCNVLFYPRCNVRRLCHCKINPHTAMELASDDLKILTLQAGDNYILLETTECGFNLPKEIQISVYKDEGAAELDTPTFIFSAPITPNQYGNTWSSSALLDRLLPRVEEVATVQVAKSLTPPSEMVGRVVAPIIPSVYQPIFVTIRIGDLAIPRTEVGSGHPVGLTLSRASRPDSPIEPLRGQRYTVLDETTKETSATSSQFFNTMDLGELVPVPIKLKEQQQPTNPEQFSPGTLLCPRRIQIFKPRIHDQFAVLLPTGRPYPIRLCAVNPLVFKASVANFKKRTMLIQLRVNVRQTTCPANADLHDDADVTPFVDQQVVSFRVTSPKLFLRSISSPKMSVMTPASSLLPRTPTFASRSVSVVTFSSPAPIDSPTRLSGATPGGEVGQSVFFGEKSEEEGAGTGGGGGGGGGDDALEADDTFLALEEFSGAPSNNSPSGLEPSKTNAYMDHKLFDPDRSSGVVSHCRPFTFTWAVQLPYFESLLRPLGKGDKLGVSASFSLLAGTTLEPTNTCQLSYSVNLVKINEIHHHTKFAVFLKQA